MRGINEVILEQGRRQVGTILESIKREYDVRNDYNVRPDKIQFQFLDNTPVLGMDGRNLGLTDHSLGQVLGRASVPVNYYDKMVVTNNRVLAEVNVNTMIKQNDGGLLVREVDGIAKGILSPAYKRMDASVAFGAFAGSALDKGYVPYTGKNTVSRYTLTFLRDNVVPIGNDEVVYGVRMTTSDYGASSLSIQMFLMRLACMNGMTGIDLFRKIHLGKRFAAEFGDDGVQLSDRTEKLDALALGSGIADVLEAAYKYEQTLTEQINNAQTTTLFDVKGMVEALRKKNKITKTFGERASEMFNNDEIGIDKLPPQKNLWRFANVISLLAKERNGDGQLDLEDVSYEVLTA